MSWHYLQEQEEASWEESSLDGAPSALLKLMPTVDESYLPANETEFLGRSQYGMTCEHSTEQCGADLLMSSAEDSHVRTSAPQAKELESTESGAGYGHIWRESFAKYDRNTHSWRTRQFSLLGGLGRVLGDLAAMGYDARWGVFSAADAGAQHKRERLWIVAESVQDGCCVRRYDAKERRLHVYGSLRQTSETFTRRAQRIPRFDEIDRLTQWTFAHDGPIRGVDGLANWMDRVSAIGNGQVPAVAKLAWHFLTPP